MGREQIIGPDGKFHEVITEHRENSNGGTVRVVVDAVIYESRRVFGITKG